jgi:hypothetical protein
MVLYLQEGKFDTGQTHVDCRDQNYDEVQLRPSVSQVARAVYEESIPNDLYQGFKEEKVVEAVIEITEDECQSCLWRIFIEVSFKDKFSGS